MILHQYPDGDSIGCTLAVARALALLGKETVVCGEGRFPATYRFLPGAAAVRSWEEAGGGFDTAVLFDCAEPALTGRGEEFRQRAATVINVDHHRSNSRYGDLNWVDPTAAAAGELAMSLVDELGAPLDPEIATCLYTSLITDTGDFRYESTTAATHRMAARLLEAGVRPGRVSEALYESRPLGALRLLSLALGRLEVTPGGRVAWISLPRELLVAAGAAEEDVEGIVNYPRSLAGVQVALLLRETADGRIKVSVRTREPVDAGALAREFGGGGHARAAGCVLAGPLEQARGLLVAAAGRAVGG